MNAILNQIWYFIRMWLYAKPVYKSETMPDGTAVPARDQNGDKIVNVPLTILGRAVQILAVLGLLSPVVLGKPVEQWVPIVTEIVKAVTGG